jgi:hypothetical protein
MIFKKKMYRTRTETHVHSHAHKHTLPSIGYFIFKCGSFV